MNFTSEDIQRYARTALQFIAGSLVSYGLISPDATWVTPTIGFAVTLVSFAWTLYGNRIQAKINEVSKFEVVDKVVVTDPAVANAAPVNVVAK